MRTGTLHALGEPKSPRVKANSPLICLCLPFQKAFSYKSRQPRSIRYPISDISTERNRAFGYVQFRIVTRVNETMLGQTNFVNADVSSLLDWLRLNGILGAFI